MIDLLKNNPVMARKAPLTAVQLGRATQTELSLFRLQTELLIAGFAELYDSDGEYVTTITGSYGVLTTRQWKRTLSRWERKTKNGRLYLDR